MTSYPWPSPEENPFSFIVPGATVGTRIKTLLCNTYAYQRLPASELANKAPATLQAFPKPRSFPWAIPDTVAVIYNMAFGAQKCKDVAGFPNVKRDGLACPLAPEGGSGSGSSVVYVSDAPSGYLPSTWTGFKTATGVVSTPPGVFVTASFTEVITMTTSDASASGVEVVTVWETSVVSTLSSGVEYTTTYTEGPTSTGASSTTKHA